MVEMVVTRIGMNQHGQALVILGDLQGERLLPIWIGMFEAHAIAIELEGEPFDRPLTHDLFTNVLEALGRRIVKIEVTRLDDRIFYALLHISDGEEVLEIDARPSDAIALALRAEADIYVAEEVLDQAGVLVSDLSDSDELTRFKELMEKADLVSGPTAEEAPPPPDAPPDEDIETEDEQ